MRVLVGLVFACLLCGCAGPSPRDYLRVSLNASVQIVSLDSAGDPVSGGTGAFIDNKGTILTAAHVVDDAEAHYAITPDGVKHKARVIDSSDAYDWALLKLDDEYEGPCLQLASELPEVGTLVLVVGTPQLIGITIAEGIVAALRPSTWKPANGEPWVQISYYVVPGYSGGPVVNARGEIIGIISHGPLGRGGDPVGIAYAVPSMWVFQAYQRRYQHPPVCG
jgi:S1-C subfamily serine protease